MEIQKQILLFFSSIHGSFLNTVFSAITFLGYEYVLIGILCFIYWNIDKKKGCLACSSMLVAGTFMGIVKAIVRFPRPWTMIDGLDSLQKETATGYSFPSGHTTNSSAALVSIARSFRKRALTIACVTVAALIGLSRMYLCVHWPTDVLGGLVVGVGTVFLFQGLLSRMYDSRNSLKVFSIAGAVMFVAFVIIGCLLTAGAVDYTAFSDLSVTVAVLSGVFFGFVLERSTTDYEVEEGCWGRKVLRFAIGLAAVLVILPGLKIVLTKINLYNGLTRAFRYFLVGFWACGLYPLVGCKVGLFSRSAGKKV